MKRMHKRRVMGAMVTTECLRHNVPGEQIAAFEEGVTCKKCLAAIQWTKDNSIAKAEGPKENQ
jgi:hypothetical protein